MCVRSPGALVRSSSMLMTAWVVARLPAVRSTIMRSPGFSHANILPELGNGVDTRIGACVGHENQAAVDFEADAIFHGALPMQGAIRPPTVEQI